MDAWVDRELDEGEFPDRRLKARLGKLLGDLGRRIGGTLPAACQDWAATKAAYRFFSNPRVDEGVILAGHFAATRARFAATAGPILVLHDTTEFSFPRDNPEAIGQLTLLKTRHATVTLCGLLMHSSLVLTPGGVPLGLAAVKFWTRDKFKGTNALKRKVNPTRIPIEQKESVRWLENLKQSTELLGDPPRCVHVGDRESDIYELFCAAEEARTHFLVRTCVDRLAEGGGTTISEVMGREPVRGVHEVEVRDDHGRVSTAELDVRFRRLTVRPPIGKQRRYPTLELTVIHADEREAPAGREPIRWRLLTNLAVDDLEGRDREAGLVRAAVQDRDLPQGAEVGLPGRAGPAPHGRAADEPAGRALRRRLAGVLADDDEPGDARGPGRGRPDEGGGRDPGPPGRGRGAAPRPTVSHYLVAVAKLGGYLAQVEGPAAGEHGDLARADPAHGHPPRL